MPGRIVCGGQRAVRRRYKCRRTSGRSTGCAAAIGLTISFQPRRPPKAANQGADAPEEECVGRGAGSWWMRTFEGARGRGQDRLPLDTAGGGATSRASSSASACG